MAVPAPPKEYLPVPNPVGFAVHDVPFQISVQVKAAVVVNVPPKAIPDVFEVPAPAKLPRAQSNTVGALFDHKVPFHVSVAPDIAGVNPPKATADV